MKDVQKDEVNHCNFVFLAFKPFNLDYLQDTPADLKATREPELDV